MSDTHDAAVEPHAAHDAPAAHDEHAAHGAEGHNHPGARQYIQIAVLLGAITAIEVAVYYVPAARKFLVPVLLTLSALKFGIVVAFYMHLKFDHRLFTRFFIAFLLLATGVISALMALFHQRLTGGAAP